MPLPAYPESPPASNGEGADWFRPTEVAWYQDVIDAGGVTHDRPMPAALQQQLRRAYYAAITNVDTQVGALLDGVRGLDNLIDANTVVVLTADHAQNLGEQNMWAMMNLRETSLRVPLMIRPALNDVRFWRKTGHGLPPASVYRHPVELVDLFPTLASLGNLSAPPDEFKLDGDNLMPGMISGQAVKRTNAAFGQITRCSNCTESYIEEPTSYRGGCVADAADAKQYFVPCCRTNRSHFDLMGMTVRTYDWRYTVFCRWNGTALRPDWGQCSWHELYVSKCSLACFLLQS